MNPDQPTATAVAVQNGRILGVGEPGDLASRFSGADNDDSFSDKVLTPGFIEAHSHMQLEGLFWKYLFVGYYDRKGPEGRNVSGCQSVDAVISRLKEGQVKMQNSTDPVIGWGYDPILLNDQPLTAAELDRVSAERPVIVFNASGHISYVNSFLLDKAGITEQTDVKGVIKDSSGQPTGELEEQQAMFLVAGFAPEMFSAAANSQAINSGAKLAHRAGCTTVAEMSCFMGPVFDSFRAQVQTPRFPVRVAVSPLISFLLEKYSLSEAVAYLDDVSKELPDKLMLGPSKWVVDGSIQGYTADLLWPGYCGNLANPIVTTPLEILKEQILPFHQAGYQLALHTNGDGATELALQAVEAILDQSPRLDHRHRLEHCQVASRSQFERIANLGMCVNLFSNHIYYWGDEHQAKTIGPDKTLRMDATATALSLGVHFSIHSDSPVTPVDPLFSAWCAVNRKTRTGRVLGDREKINVEDALAAITVGSAYLLHRDGDLGSIEVGKYADFTVLEEDPLGVSPEELKDVPVWGTVLGGEILPVAA